MSNQKLTKRIFRNWAGTVVVLVFFLTGMAYSLTEQKKEDQFQQQTRQWQQSRLKQLKAPNSWLSLAGLFWLNDGGNTFGSDAKIDFQIDKKGAPPLLGTFILKQETIRFKTHPGIQVMHNGEVVKDILLKSDSTGKPTTLQWDSLSWFIIKRGDKFAVRLRDSKHPRINKLKKIDTFPIQKKWLIPARLIRYKTPKILQVPTVLGTVSEQKSPGILKFSINNKPYQLHPTSSGKYLFIVFGDETNSQETYYGGRFLTVKIAEEGQTSYIDFNKAYNPPCVFSHFATCPLPVKENILAVRITAGEKMVHLK